MSSSTAAKMSEKDCSPFARGSPRRVQAFGVQATGSRNTVQDPGAAVKGFGFRV